LRELLKNKANVHFPHENCHSSKDILANIEAYLGNKPWDVIHFNCGIHDVTRLNEAGKSIRGGEQGKVRVSEEEYRNNLEKIIARLKQTDAELIWCTSTPVDDIFAHRKPHDIERYNAVAKEVMQKHGIPVTDLHKQVSRDGKPKWTDGAHFTIEGSTENAAIVAPAIEAALSKRLAGKR
jgi:lysophospholipase L1-like esterase